MSIRVLVVLTFILFPHSVFAQIITSCQNPQGKAFYHFSGLTPRENSGWQDDKITGGITMLQKLDNDKYDILFVDIRKKVLSLTQDVGGSVKLFRKGAKDASFLYYFPGRVLEIYTFWQDSEGNYKLDIISSKGGSWVIHKSSILVADCAKIDFSLIW